MAEHLKKLGPKHDQAIIMFAEGKTIAEVAKATGVHVNRVYVWRQSPVFMMALQEAQQQARTEGLEILKTSTRSAASYLVQAISRTDSNSNPIIDGIGIKAATELLDRAGLIASLEPGRSDIDVRDHRAVLGLLLSIDDRLLAEALAMARARRDQRDLGDSDHEG